MTYIETSKLLDMFWSCFKSYQYQNTLGLVSSEHGYKIAGAQDSTTKQYTMHRILDSPPQWWINHPRNFYKVLSALVEKTPVYVFQTKDKEGKLPLHYSLTLRHEMFKKEECIMALVLKKSPRAAWSKTNDGEYPLHVACSSSGFRTDMICELVDRYPQAIMRLDKSGRLPIHNLCSRTSSVLDSVKVIEQFFKLEPNCVCSEDAKRQIPLHMACWGSKDRQLVSLLIKLFPQGVKKKDDSGNLPIHLAASSCPKLVPILLKSFPESIDIPTRERRHALHLACRYSPSSFNDNDYHKGIVELIKAGPQHASTPYQSSKMLPLHQVCANGLSMEVVKALVEAYPDAVKIPDANGDLPAHHVVRSSRHRLDVVRYLHALYPQGFWHPNHSNQRPISLCPHQNDRLFITLSKLAPQTLYNDTARKNDDKVPLAPLIQYMTTHHRLPASQADLMRQVFSCAIQPWPSHDTTEEDEEKEEEEEEMEKQKEEGTREHKQEAKEEEKEMEVDMQEHKEEGKQEAKEEDSQEAKEDRKEEGNEEDKEKHKKDEKEGDKEEHKEEHKEENEKATMDQQTQDMKKKYQDLEQAYSALLDINNKLTQEKKQLQDTLEVQLTQEKESKEKDKELHQTLEHSQAEVLHLQNKVQSLEEELKTSECAHKNTLEDQEGIRSLYGRIIAQGRLWDQHLIGLLKKHCDPNDGTTSSTVPTTEIFKALAVSLQKRSQLVQPNTGKDADESSMFQFMLQTLLSQPSLSHSSLLELIHRLDRQLEPLDQQIASACKRVLTTPTCTQQDATSTQKRSHRLEDDNSGEALSPITLDETLTSIDHGSRGPNKRARVSIS